MNLTNRRLLRGLAATVMAAMLLAGCSGAPSGGGGPESSGPAAVAESANKPDVTTLTEELFLTADEFPISGEYRLDPPKVKTVDKARGCGWTGIRSAGDAGVGTDASSIRVNLTAFDPVLSPECKEEALRPQADAVDVDGMPSGVSVVDDSDSKDVRLFASGVVRGVLVQVKVVRLLDSSQADEATADLVTVYNRQAEKLNKF